MKPATTKYIKCIFPDSATEYINRCMGAAKGLPTQPTLVAANLPTSQTEKKKKKKTIPNPSPPQRSSPQLRSTAIPRSALRKSSVRRTLYCFFLFSILSLSSANDSPFTQPKNQQSSTSTMKMTRMKKMKFPSFNGSELEAYWFQRLQLAMANLLN